MTDPFGGRKVVTTDPVTNLLAPLVDQNYLHTSDLLSIAPKNNAVLTGNPTAPTAVPGDNDTSLATTAFVQAAITAAVTAALRDTFLNLYPANGVYPPRPATIRPVLFMEGAAARPPNTGSTSGGGGMVDGFDRWWQ